MAFETCLSWLVNERLKENLAKHISPNESKMSPDVLSGSGTGVMVSEPENRLFGLETWSGDRANLN